MGYCQTLKPHVKYLSKVAKESLKILRGFVFLVGKPFFIILLLLFEAFNILILAVLYCLQKTSKISILPSDKFRLWEYKKPVLLCVFIFIFLPFYVYILKDLPSPKRLSTNPPPMSTKIYDKNMVLLYKIYSEQNRTNILISEVPRSVILATLAIEDNEFYQHPGFSIKGILRAAITNFTQGTLYGGSTITQQLVKNTLLTPEKSLRRKIKELILSVEVELTYSKNEILEMYLNTSPYGGPVYGIKEASNYYFNKNASELNLAEAAFLAGIPKSPNNFSPFIGSFDSSLERQKKVLNLMLENKYIENDEYQKALSEKLEFSNGKTNILAPHFVMYVKALLENKLGENAVSNQGFEVVTTLDIGIQKMAESVVSQEISKLTKYKVTNAGVLVVDPKNGDILAMVGSNDYFDVKNDGNVNTVFSPRPPGSSIKVVNYAYALENGYTLSSMVDDSPVVYRAKGAPDYAPVNYDRTFKGPMSLRSALAQSRNVPAVKILYSYGVKNMINMGENLGITTWNNPKNYGLSITLGGANTTLFDLAKVYSVFADYGIKKDLNPILSIQNYNGVKIANNSCFDQFFKSDIEILPTVPHSKKNKVVDLLTNSLVNLSYASFSANQDQNEESKKTCQKKQVLDPRVAFLITNVLSDNYARSPTFGLNSQLNINNHSEVAVKTGTSNSMRDNIAMGYNQDYLVAVWVGNNDNSPMSNIASGITGATPIFNKIMTNLLKDKVSVDWTIPSGLSKKSVCFYSKKPDSDEVVVKKYEEWFLDETTPKNICSSLKK